VSARDFIDHDGTMTQALQQYVQDHNLDFPLTRTPMKGGGEKCNSLCMSPDDMA
jgi:hypothetical protein